MEFGKLRLPLLAAGLSAALLSTSIAIAQPQLPETSKAPVKTYGESKPIPNRYIITFKDSVRDVKGEAERLMAGRGGEIHFVYTHAIKGVAVSIPEQAYQAIASSPWVESIHEDKTISVNQTNATWGLDRIDQRPLPLDGTYDDSKTGAGVYAFIIDTGILASHAEFGGRVDFANGYSAISDKYGNSDCNGHGTHVAGTVGGSTYGVAKNVTLIPVRVLGCTGSGSTSGVIAGVDFVAASTKRPAVANMSLGGGYDSLLNKAVAGAVGKGVTMVVAAGNETTDACSRSPASEPTAITVGATEKSDSRASYSNSGTCLDLFAPGTGITSAWYTSTTATNTISGTSMATPHVTGAAALAIEMVRAEKEDPGYVPTASEVSGKIISTATLNKVTSAGTGSPNLLLFSLMSGPDNTNTPPPTNPTPSTPTAPTNLMSSSQTATTITLGWTDKSNNESGFYVDTSTNGGKIWTRRSYPSNTTSVTVSGLKTQTTYTIRVIAFTSSGSGTLLSGPAGPITVKTK